MLTAEVAGTVLSTARVAGNFATPRGENTRADQLEEGMGGALIGDSSVEGDNVRRNSISCPLPLVILQCP